MIFIREEVEDAFHVLGQDGINLDHASTVDADVAVAVGAARDEPALLHAAGQPLADIDRLLFGVEAGHVRQRPPHHAAGGRVFGRLGNGNERQVVFRLQPFEFDIIEEVAGGPVHLVEKQAVIWHGMTRVSTLLNSAFSDEIMDLMVESGCWKVAVGIESGSDEMLKRIHKMVTVPQVIDAARKLARFGIQMKGFFIMGFPGETESQIRETRDLIYRLKNAGMTKLSLFQFKPYPGTEDFERLQKSNPAVLERLDYLRINGSDATSGVVRHRSGQHDVWLPDDVMVADISSAKVKQYVISTLEHFYGQNMT